MPSSILGIHPGADLLHRLLHQPPPLLLPLLLLLGKRLLDEEADCDAIVITRETMARQRRHSGSHVTDRDCPPLHPRLHELVGVQPSCPGRLLSS